MSSSSDSVESYTHGKPTDGMMCLCTMEDITEEDQNYVEYQSYPSGIWKPALFEATIVEELLETQFHQYISRVKTTDCQAELKRLLAAGPPIYLQDKHALPLALEDDTHISTVWFAKDNRQVSAKLNGAVEGEERDVLWEELKQFIIVEGKEEGDDDDNEKNDEK